MATLLVMGILVSTWQAVRATRAGVTARAAEQRAEAGEKLANDRLLQVDAEEKKAEEEKQIAQAVGTFLRYKLLGQADARTQADTLLRAGGRTAEKEAKENPTIRELLDRAARELSPERIDASFPQPLVQAEILQTVGNTYLGVGEYQAAIGFLQRSAALYRQHLGPEHADTLTSMNSLALAYKAAGTLDPALPIFEETLKVRKAKLGSDHPDTLAAMNNLAMAYQSAGSSIWQYPSSSRR